MEKNIIYSLVIIINIVTKFIKLPTYTYTRTGLFYLNVISYTIHKQNHNEYWKKPTTTTGVDITSIKCHVNGISDDV
jgi:hypothetical protein